LAAYMLMEEVTRHLGLLSRFSSQCSAGLGPKVNFRDMRQGNSDAEAPEPSGLGPPLVEIAQQEFLSMGHCCAPWPCRRERNTLSHRTPTGQSRAGDTSRLRLAGRDRKLIRAFHGCGFASVFGLLRRAGLPSLKAGWENRIGATSALGLGCVKTRVFTQPGSNPEVAAVSHHFRFNPDNGHPPQRPACLKSARKRHGLQHRRPG
jgi:hypothetical protein